MNKQKVIKLISLLVVVIVLYAIKDRFPGMVALGDLISVAIFAIEIYMVVTFLKKPTR